MRGRAITNDQRTGENTCGSKDETRTDTDDACGIDNKGMLDAAFIACPLHAS